MSLTSILSSLKLAVRFALWALAAGAAAWGGMKTVDAKHWKVRAGAEALAHAETKRRYTAEQAMAELLAKADADQQATQHQLTAMKARYENEKRSAAYIGAVTDFLRVNGVREQTAAGASRRPDMSGGPTLSAGAVQTPSEAPIPAGAYVPATDLYTVAAAYAQCEALIGERLAIGRGVERP